MTTGITGGPWCECGNAAPYMYKGKPCCRRCRGYMRDADNVPDYDPRDDGELETGQ